MVEFFSSSATLFRSLLNKLQQDLTVPPNLRCSGESLVGIYDDPDRDPREHVISIAFLCRIADGETKPGAKVDAVNSVSEAETKNLEIAFDRNKTVKYAFSMLKNLEALL